MNYWFGDSSDVIHVAKTGSDGNLGFAAQYPVNLAADAKLTIASALSVVPDGGTIIVWPGTYNEQVDIRTAAKSITMMGTHKHKCIISWNTASGPSAAVYGYAKCKFANMSIIQTGAGKALDCEGQHRCEFEDLYVSSSGIDGLYLMMADYARVRRCYIFACYDALVIGDMGSIEDSIIVTDGCYEGTGQARAIAGTGSGKILVQNSIVLAQPSFGKPTGKSPPIYTSQRDLESLTAFASALLENCVIAADGLKPTGTNSGSSASGNAVCVSLVGSLHANNCRFVCRTDQGQSGTEAYAIKATASNLINSYIQCQGQAVSFDFFTGTHYLQNVNYNSSQLAVGANIVLSSIGNTKAIKLLKNKAVQNKLTGAIQYFDDDGVTPVLTHTPMEDGSSLTRTVS